MNKIIINVIISEQKHVGLLYYTSIEIQECECAVINLSWLGIPF